MDVDELNDTIATLTAEFAAMREQLDQITQKLSDFN